MTDKHDKQANKNKDLEQQQIDEDYEMSLIESDYDDSAEWRDELDWTARTQSQGGIYKNSGDNTIQ